MKKLMIVAAIMLAAIVTQAANVKWTTAKLFAPNADGSFSANALGSESGYTFNVLMTFFDADGNELPGLTGGLSANSVASKGSTAGNTTVGDIFVVDTDYKYQADYSLVYGGKEYTMTTSGTFTNTKGTGNQNLTVAVASAWSAVPEPTSGLLLLLGVAGLALRRRRA